jgi:L-ribulose-5-phosphate 3-epimerase UlaE
MAANGVLKINHRELILSSTKKARFGFLNIPCDLQDQIIDRMDTNTMSCAQASQLIEQRGFKLSHEAISDYYKAVRLRRADLLLKAATSN